MVSSAPSPVRPVALWRHVLVAVWAFGLLGLGVRSLVTDDSRYGFGMFSHKVMYRLQYTWVMENGRRVAHKPGDELRGVAKSYLRTDRLIRSYYATGSMKAQVKDYTAYMVIQHPRAGAAKFEAKVRHRKYNEDSFTVTTISTSMDEGS